MAAAGPRAGRAPEFCTQQFKQTQTPTGAERATCIHCLPDAPTIIDYSTPEQKWATGSRFGTVADAMRANAQLFGDRLLLIDDGSGRRVTHRDFLRRCEGLGRGLRLAGVPPGGRVAVLARNCAEYLELYGAAALWGLVVVPINIAFSADEVSRVAADAEPHVFVADAPCAATLRSAGCGGTVVRLRAADWPPGPDAGATFEEVAGTVAGALAHAGPMGFDAGVRGLVFFPLHSISSYFFAF
eukprot:gene4785-7639_t